MAYRPHLDGLRGIAIGLVLVQHFVGWPRGVGGVGVALFFALSGYLITGLLLDEHEQRGRIDLFAFYARRAGRLVPGLLVMIVVTAPLLAATTQLATGRGAFAALSYTTNIGSIARWVPTANPYLHTWSLAIEEHFYLAWAPALMFAAGRGGRRAVLWTALVGAAIATAWRLDVAAVTHSGLWVAWGSLARGDALLLGCAAAAAKGLGWQMPRIVTPLAFITLGAIAVAGVTQQDGHPVALAVQMGALSLASTGVVVGAEREALLRAALSMAPLVRLGTLSYSVYLWHVPLLYLLGPVLPRLAVLAVALLVAALSFYCVERPARGAVRRRLHGRTTPRRAASPVRAAPLDYVV